MPMVVILYENLVLNVTSWTRKHSEQLPHTHFTISFQIILWLRKLMLYSSVFGNVEFLILHQLMRSCCYTTVFFSSQKLHFLLSSSIDNKKTFFSNGLNFWLTQQFNIEPKQAKVIDHERSTGSFFERTYQVVDISKGRRHDNRFGISMFPSIKA